MHEVLIENNTLMKFKQDMLQYTSLYMINNSLYDIYFDMIISVQRILFISIISIFIRLLPDGSSLFYMPARID